MSKQFVVAQAGSTSSSSTAAPVQIIKVIKPEAGHTEIFHASYDGTVKIDFTAIANEKITLYHDQTDQTLHIIFTDGAQAIIEPFFDSMGVMSNMVIEVAPNQDLTGAQFATQFPITTDQAVLPAAGPGTPGTPPSGADFQPVSVPPLETPPPLPLLPPEELPPIQFHNVEGVVLPGVLPPTPPTVTVTVTVGAEPDLLTFDGGLAGGNFVGTQAATDTNPSAVIATEDFSGGFVFSGNTSPISYTLGFAAGFSNGGASGLTHHGATIYLYNIGGVFTGSTSATQGGVTAGNTAFTLSVNSSTGVATLTQFETLDQAHTDTYNGAFINDVISLASGIVVLTASTGDTSASFDLGGHVSFGDDGPQPALIRLADTVVPTLLTFDGGLPGGNFFGTQDPADTDPSPRIATEDFSGAFTVGNQGSPNLFGADAPGALHFGYAFGFASGFSNGGDSGLTHGGLAIHLYAIGGGITGSTSATLGGVTAGNTVFTLSVVGGTGLVTLTQFETLDHSHTDTYSGSYINDVISLTAGKIVLAASAYTTDSEGDLSVVATAVLDLGGHVTFGDDGPLSPTVSVSGANEPVLLTFDGGLPGGNFFGTQDPVDADPSLTVATEDFSGAFTNGSQSFFGADGPGAAHISYALAFASGFTPGATTGLFHAGLAIHMYDIGGVFTGSTSATQGGVTAGNTVFTLSISGSNVTLTQFETLDHTQADTYNGSYINDVQSLAADIVDVVATGFTTDSEGDRSALASASFDLGGHVTFGDDGPLGPTVIATADTLVLDESRPVGSDTAGGAAPAGLATTTANFADNFSTPPNFGSDGPLGGTAASGTSYALVLTGTNVASGLYALDNTDTTAGDGDGIGQGAQILLTQSGNTITGSAGGINYFTISIDPSTGIVTFTQLNNIWHSDTTNPDDLATLTLANANLLQVVQTLTDSDSDHASTPIDLGVGVFTIQDSGPTASTVTGTTDTLVLDESRPVGTDTTVHTDPLGLATVTANFSDNFTGGSFGTDGAGSTVYTLKLTGSNVASGLFALDATDTTTGDGDGIGQGTQIVLNQSGDVITGSVGATTYFTISINETTGVVTFTQVNNIWHSDTTNPDDLATLTAAAGVLQIVQTLTDADGDHVSTPIDLGTGVFTIQDSGPTASTVTGTTDTLVLDESRPVGTDTTVHTDPLGLATVTANFSDNFTGGSLGTDGAGSTVYTLKLTGSNVASGLFALDATDTTTGDGDGIGQGTQIVLNQSGDVITGSVGATTYFTISINETTGVVTFTQVNNIWHSDTTNPDDLATLTLANANLLQIVQTLTDADGDHVSTPIDLGTGVFTIQDSGPTASTVTGTTDTLVLDESRPVGTDTTVHTDPLGLATVTANFSDNFTGGSLGTDGAGSTVYTLKLTGSNVASGLFALDATDTTTGDGDGIGQGTQIVLNQSGDVITGSVGATTYFTISINESTGVVTFTQVNNIWHSDTTNPDDLATLTLANANLLQVVQTLTDADGDHVSTPIDLGVGVFTIQDSGPTASTVTGTTDTLVLDESRPVGTDTTVHTLPLGLATVTANFSDNFTGGSFGTDGAGSTVYTLKLTGSNVASGLFALDATDVTTGDGDGYGQGTQIVLNQSGDIITGSVGATTYFTISINESTGVVTFTQVNNIWHSDTTNPDDLATLTAAAGVLQIVQTLTDADGDHVSTPIDLGTGVFTIQDSGPSLLAKSNLVYANVDNGTGDVGGTGIYHYDIGTDSRTVYDPTHSDFLPITLSGNVGGVAITPPPSSPEVTWVSEDASQATFHFDFFYAPDPLNPGVTVEDTGTLTFDKVAGTYNVVLDQPIGSVTTLHTAGGLSFVGYNFGGDTPTGSQPDVMVTELSSDFWVQFTGQASVGGGNPVIVTSVTPPGTPPGDITFNQGDFFAAADTWVSVSGSANGVAGDTLQRGEILNFNFYASDPHGHLNQTDITAAPTMFLKFDGYNGENMIVNLHVVDVGADGVAGTLDDGQTRYLALVVDAVDVYTNANPPSGFTIPLDQNDGAIIIQNNDYAGFLGAGDWQIEGAQVLPTSGLVSGTAVNFNGLTTFDDPINNGASTATEAFGPQAEQETIKISDIGLITSTTTTQSADLQFGVTNTDADGDTTATSTLDVQITGTTMSGTALADVLQSSAGNDTMTGNGGNDIFALNGHSLAPGVGAGGIDTITDFASLADQIFVDVPGLSLTVGNSTTISGSGATQQFTSSTVTGGTENDASAWNENGSAATNKFFFNAGSAELWYSANGTGSDKIDLAHISTGVVAQDIHIG